MSGFINGKGLKSNSVNIKDKLDEQNHTTDMNDGKSIVNVEALSAAVSSGGGTGGGDTTVTQDVNEIGVSTGDTYNQVLQNIGTSFKEAACKFSWKKVQTFSDNTDTALFALDSKQNFVIFSKNDLRDLKMGDYNSEGIFTSDGGTLIDEYVTKKFDFFGVGRLDDDYIYLNFKGLKYKAEAGTGIQFSFDSLELNSYGQIQANGRTSFSDIPDGTIFEFMMFPVLSASSIIYESDAFGTDTQEEFNLALEDTIAFPAPNKPLKQKFVRFRKDRIEISLNTTPVDFDVLSIKIPNITSVLPVTNGYEVQFAKLIISDRISTYESIRVGSSLLDYDETSGALELKFVLPSKGVGDSLIGLVNSLAIYFEFIER